MAGAPWATQTVRVWRASVGGRDAEGRKVTSLEVGQVVRASVHERTSRELVGDTYEQVSEWRALLPPLTDVGREDVLESVDDGTRYRVMTVVPRRGPGGAVHHISCRVMRVEP